MGNFAGEGVFCQVVGIWQGMIFIILTFFKARNNIKAKKLKKLKTILSKYWALIKIKIGMTYVYKEY